ncbi:MAG: FIST signal transduction protein, partial [Flavicella sp.]
IGVKHGWKKLEGPYIVTKSKGNVIQEINWEAPFKVYKDIVENSSSLKFNDDNFFEIAKGYPLGIIKQELDYVVRDPIAFNENDELICVCNVEENSLINVLKGEPDNLLTAATQASEESLLHAENPQLAIVIDCISRVLYLDDTFDTELQNITKTIHEKYPGIPVNGALTLGEISSYGNGYIEFYNKTIVVGLFE